MLPPEFILVTDSHMPKIFLFLFFTVLTLSARSQPATVSGRPFARGEHLTYHIYFHSTVTGSVKAGNFELLLTDEQQLLNGRRTLHAIARGKTDWALDVFYKVDDRFESYMDDVSLLPMLALRRIKETDFFRDQDLIFDHAKKSASYKDNLKKKGRILSIEDGTLDILSAVYQLRAADFPTSGTFTKTISYVFSDSLRSSTLRFSGPEMIKTRFGPMECIKVQPEVIIGSVFRTRYPLTIWVSNDPNRLPVRVESEIVMGKVRVELIQWEGLRFPFNAAKTKKSPQGK